MCQVVSVIDKSDESYFEGRPGYIWTDEHIQGHFLTSISLGSLPSPSTQTGAKSFGSSVERGADSVNAAYLDGGVYDLSDLESLLDELANQYHVILNDTRMTLEHLRSQINRHCKSQDIPINRPGFQRGFLSLILGALFHYNPYFFFPLEMRIVRRNHRACKRFYTRRYIVLFVIIVYNINGF